MDKIATQRSFVLGDKWLYYKIYTGPKTSDLILTEVFFPIISSLLRDKIIDKWFFIRYSDPEHHLRIRFHYNEPDKIAYIINLLSPPLTDLINQDMVWKIQTDTYERELRRYGENTMDLAELIFFHDSQMVLKFLSFLESDGHEELRWLFSLLAIDSFLTTFNFGKHEKYSLLQKIRTGFAEEFAMSRSLKKQLDKKYREAREKIESFMDLNSESKPKYAIIIQILEDKSLKIKATAAKILEHEERRTLQQDIEKLMGSFIHMFMNRLFKSKNRMHELVCYDFLCRYYKSSIARSEMSRQKSKLGILL
ncbi:thiopeptide-type bacteriocin biosynthesis protein [Poritiphilus flavus]|uniref:Thiopeptide-type bacteriocin biosynthesis domain-containing protein n=1 Tax=Poritiphilus flavus TaxID=2697053 RepID=A0A6L9EEB6_9FLAO|nr:thiopeptide-type bacteriocin biosynthesis protein [Poritiphilus flavus]NAS13003.1 hypothetical protein [Poritiphilus flavus]